MAVQVSITPAGRAYRQELVEAIQEENPNRNNFEKLDDMRHLWILDQYLKGKSSAMTGPVMGPECELLIEWGFLEAT